MVIWHSILYRCVFNLWYVLNIKSKYDIFNLICQFHLARKETHRCHFTKAQALLLQDKYTSLGVNLPPKYFSETASSVLVYCSILWYISLEMLHLRNAFFQIVFPNRDLVCTCITSRCFHANRKKCQ